MYGDGLNVRDWLYVQDHCRAIDLILNAETIGKTYLIGGLNKDISNLEVVKLILNLMGKDEQELEFVPDRAGHDRRYAVGWDLINRELGWEPSVTLEEGLKRTIDWYTTHEAWWRPLKEQAKSFFKKNYEERK